MEDKLIQIQKRFRELEDRLSQPVSPKERLELGKLHGELFPIVETWEKFQVVQKCHEEALFLMQEEKDPAILELARLEYSETQEEMDVLGKDLQVLLLPKDPLDSKNVVLEIRAGTGGEEASLFAGDLLRMYSRYAERQKWSWEMLSLSPSSHGGVKEVCLLIQGDRVYSKLKFESGVHRVQRVPATESQGRVHTSACTVAVLPEADEVEVFISPADLRMDTFRASGAGGQHVNRTDSAVRITHVPSGIIVECQEERSQHKNREKAMKMLRTRLYEQKRSAQEAMASAERKAQVGSGDRSERIRTYNFPQGRVTDHRIGLTLYDLPQLLEGHIDPIVIALGTHDTAARLERREEM